MNTQPDPLSRHGIIPAMLGVCVTFLFYFPVLGYSQRVMLGVKVGGQITKTFTQPPFSAPFPAQFHEDRAVLGPMAEVRLPRRISLEVDALYKGKLNYTQSVVIADATEFRETFVTIDLNSRSWEIPVVAKWRVLERRHSVFVGGGFSSRKVTGSTHTYGTTVSLQGFPPTTFDLRTPVANPWTYGPVLNGGLDIRVGIIHFQPELRYTHWNGSPFSGNIPFADNIPTSLSTLQVLVGVAAGK